MFAGRLTRWVGGKVLVVAGCLTGAVAMGILAFAHGHEGEIYLSSAIMGIGFGLAFSAMSALVVAAVPSSQTGVASGMNANIRTIGGSIGAAVIASIVTSSLEPSGLPKESGYTTGFAVMAAALARHTDNAAVQRIRAAIDELTTRARAAGTVNPGITASDVLVLVWAMRGLVQAAGEAAPEARQRFLDIQLAGLRATGPLSSTPPLSSRQLPELALPTSALRPAGQAGLGLTVGSGRAVLAGIVLVPDVTGKRTHVRTQGQRQQRHACHLFESDGIFYCVERIMAPGEGTVARG